MPRWPAAEAKRKMSAEAGPAMQQPAAVHPQKPQRRGKLGWCRFRAKGRCYVEGAFLDEADQEITLSPAAAYRLRNNKNLELIEGEIPQLPDDAPKRPSTNEGESSGEARRQFAEYENDFIGSLEDGDPIVGPPLTVTKLVKQG